MTPLERTSVGHLTPAPAADGGREPDGIYEIRTTSNLLLWDSGLAHMRSLPLPDDLDLLGQVDDYEAWWATWTSASVHLDGVTAIDASRGPRHPVAMWISDPRGERIGYTEPVVAIHRITLPEPLISVGAEPDLIQDLARRVERTIVLSTTCGEVVVIESGSHIDSWSTISYYYEAGPRRAAWHREAWPMWQMPMPVLGRRYAYACDVGDERDSKRSTVGVVTHVRVLAGL